MTLIDRIKLFFSTRERVYKPTTDTKPVGKPRLKHVNPAVKRKWQQLHNAMMIDDHHKVTELQNQLIDSGHHAPIKLSEAKKLCQD